MSVWEKHPIEVVPVDDPVLFPGGQALLDLDGHAVVWIAFFRRLLRRVITLSLVVVLAKLLGGEALLALPAFVRGGVLFPVLAFEVTSGWSVMQVSGSDFVPMPVFEPQGGLMISYLRRSRLCQLTVAHCLYLLLLTLNLRGLCFR